MDNRSGIREPSIDARTDYSRNERKPRHQWTVSHHVTLVFLARFYENHWKDITNIFNTYFSSELRNPNGLSSGALVAMYNDMNRGRTGKDAMKLIRGTAFPFVTGSTYVDKNAIEQTATELGIQLLERPLRVLPRGLKPPKKPRTVKRKAVALEEDTDFLSEHESARRASKMRQHPEPLPQTPERHNHLGARDGLLTPPGTSSQQSIPTLKRLPPVAYRAFSSESQGSYTTEEGFRAGAFVDSEVPLPPEPQSQEYLEEAKRVK